MKTVLMACCDSVSIDAATNRLSLFNLLDTAGSPVFPFALPQLSLIVWVERGDGDPDEFQIQTVWKANGRVVGEIVLDGKFGTALKTRAIGHIAGVIIPEPGRFVVEARYNKQILGDWAITVLAIGVPRNVDVPRSRSETTASGGPLTKKATQRRTPPRKRAGS